MKFIGLCGLPGAGKTEVRKILMREYDFRLINTKTPLISVASHITEQPLSVFSDPKHKDDLFLGYSYRQIMGKIGNTIEEMFGDNFLVDRAITPYKNSSGNFVVDSLRKSQPANFDGWVVEVKSHREKHTGNTFDKYDASKVNFTIQNNGDMAELEREVASMIVSLGIII